MDTGLEELRFQKVIGILHETFRVFRSHAKLFLGLTLTLIVPLCLVGLGHTVITAPIAARIDWDVSKVESEAEGSAAAQKTSLDIHRELVKLWLVLALYLFFLLAFALLSTSAVVYSVACIFSEKVTSFRKVLSVVPRVWKRLIVTFLVAIFVLIVYIMMCLVIFFIAAVVFGILFGQSPLVTKIIVWVGVVFFTGNIIYINCVWHLGSVITVLEESYGFQALLKSLKLIQGRQLVGIGLFSLYSLCTFGIDMSFRYGVVKGGEQGVPLSVRVLLGCVLILVLSFVDLVGFIIQTVFYFACKAYHHESIDRLQLSEHLGAYLGEYVPLRGSIQMEAYEP